MSRSSPEFHAAFAVYRQALEGGAHKDVTDELWRRVMKALHDTPEPPVIAAHKKAVTALQLWEANHGHNWPDAKPHQSIDDWHDEMMGEGGR